MTILQCIDLPDNDIMQWPFFLNELVVLALLFILIVVRRVSYRYSSCNRCRAEVNVVLQRELRQDILQHQQFFHEVVALIFLVTFFLILARLDER